MGAPELSIVILTYNRKRLLRDCLTSLLSQQEPAGRIELIVADDGSTDGTQAFVAELAQQHSHIRYVRQPHRGIPAVRNLGITAAKADLIAIVADDYVFSPDYATTIFRFFQELPKAAIIRFEIVAAGHDLSSRLSHFYYEISFLNRLHPQREQPSSRWAWFLQYFRRIPLPEEKIKTDHELEAAGAAAFRREVFKKVGLFDERLLRAEDTDMTRRLKAINVPVHYYPFHKVKHQYAFACVDTIGKCFDTGLHRYLLYKKYAGKTTIKDRAVGAVYALLDQFLRSIWRARQAKRAWQFFLYFPAMLFFETAVKAGFCWGVVRVMVSWSWRRRSSSDI